MDKTIENGYDEGYKQGYSDGVDSMNKVNNEFIDDWNEVFPEEGPREVKAEIESLQQRIEAKDVECVLLREKAKAVCDWYETDGSVGGLVDPITELATALSQSPSGMVYCPKCTKAAGSIREVRHLPPVCGLKSSGMAVVPVDELQALRKNVSSGFTSYALSKIDKLIKAHQEE